jgi:putative two-component system response regulator
MTQLEDVAYCPTEPGVEAGGGSWVTGPPGPSATAQLSGPTVAPELAEAKLLIADGPPAEVEAVLGHLRNAGYTRLVLADPTAVVERILEESPDAVLLDLDGPRISGLATLRKIRGDRRIGHVPVLMLTPPDQREMMVRALDLGATDFVAKPVDFVQLLPRVRGALAIKGHHDQRVQFESRVERRVRERTAELARTRLELIHCLGRAAEYRDNDTGRHVMRVGRYAGIVARQLGMDLRTVELIGLAAPLHDLGKLGIPDAILLKPGKLGPEEFEVMRKHCSLGKRAFEPMSLDQWQFFQAHTRLGGEILEAAKSPVLEMASRIALTHHEKWDGTGYPLGLAGEDIPVEGRITAVADVFDALSSRRVYKPAIPLHECFKLMSAERGRHFDPRVLDAFLACHEEIVQTRIELADLDEPYKRA